MKTAKRFLSVLLSLCLVLGLIPGTAFAASGNLPFTDVNTTDWYHDAVQYVYGKGMMSGTSATAFAPNETTSRGMIVTVLYRMEGMPTASGAVFTDVSSGQWYTNAVTWANANNIVGGYGNGLFGPGDAITREQMSSILYRYSQYKGYPVSAASSLSAFPDAAQTSSYAVDAMNWAVGSGLIAGVGGNLDPKGSATRAQVATILQRYCENVVPANTAVPDTSAPDTTPIPSTVDTTYTVTFDLNYGSNTQYESKTVKEGEAVSKPSNPSRNGYSFSGWYAEKSGGKQFDFKTVITADLTLYAHWTRNNSGSSGSGGSYVPPSTTYYTVTFYMNDGTNAVHTTATVAAGDSVLTPTQPTRSSYSFDGWYMDAATTTAYNFSSAVIGNLELYAKWNRGGSTNPSNPDTYTRGEWIQALAEKLGMNLDVEPDEVNYSYADIENTPYGVAIETAERYGILPPPDLEDTEQDVPLFKPDQPATREFAAYTAVRAMGFTEGPSAQSDFYNNISTWDDSGSITYPNEASIAVGFRFLELHGNRFDPTASIVGVDATTIFAAIDALNVSLELAPEDEHVETSYVEGVFGEELSGVTSYTVLQSSNTYIVTLPKAQAPGVTEFAVGDVIILPSNESYPSGFALKITNAASSDSAWILSGTTPELGEIYEDVDIAVHGEVDLEAFDMTPEDGVEVEYDPNGSLTRNARIGGTTSVPGTFKFKLNDKSVGNLRLKGEIEVEIPELTCILKGNIRRMKVEQFTVAVGGKIKFQEQLTYTLAETGYEIANGNLLGDPAFSRPSHVGANSTWEGGKVELKRIPFKVAPFVSADLVFYLNISAKGTLSITYTIDTRVGFEYINGSFRGIFDYNDSLDFLELKGSAKAGLGIGIVLNAFSFIDVVGFTTEGGPAFNASFTPHVLATDTLFCADITLYAYWETSLEEDTLIGGFLKDYLHYELKFEHLKNNGSNPFKLKFHVENCKVVPECTFGRGEIHGSVFQADNQTTPIQNARVNIYTLTDNPNYPGDPDKATATMARTKYTDAQGQFKVDNLIPGSYKVMISATGYKTYTATVKVERTGATNIPAFLMVDRNNTGSQTVTGDIMDAVTGNGVSATNYVLRKGQNIQTGVSIDNGAFADATYTLTLEPGTYTLEISKADYITTYQTITVTDTGATGTHITLNPTNSTSVGDGILRVVLEWGTEPKDLDSHMFGPTSNDSASMFHTYYSNREYSDSGTIVADLDRDDTDGEGPETTTVRDIRTGRGYSFYVHDYTNKEKTNSNAMSMSGATVKVYSDNALIRTFAIPTNCDGTVWHVFDYNSTTKTLMPVNTFSYSSDPGSLGIQAQATDNDYLLCEENAIRLITESTEQLKEGSTTESSQTAMGTVEVTVTDAYGMAVDAKYNLRSGANNTNGEITASGELPNGKYLAILTVGNYTLEVGKDGYTAFVDIVVQENVTAIINAELMSTSGDSNEATDDTGVANDGEISEWTDIPISNASNKIPDNDESESDSSDGTLQKADEPTNSVQEESLLTDNNVITPGAA